jgi:hypothetical protein
MCTAMASESQTAWPSSACSAGTRAEGECFRISAVVVSVSSRISVSVNGCFARFSTSQGRSDQEDLFLSPMISSTRTHSLGFSGRWGFWWR